MNNPIESRPSQYDVNGPDSDREYVLAEFPDAENVDGRVQVLLLSVNMGHKAAAIHILPPSPDDYLSIADTGNRFRAAMAGTEYATMTNRTISEYYTVTLVPLGLVAEEIAIDQGLHRQIIGFAATEAGNRYGRPAAALAAFFEKNYGISVYHIFGQVASRSKEDRRAPGLRARILRLFYEESADKDGHINKDNPRVFNPEYVKEKLGYSKSDESVGQALKYLSDIGILARNGINYYTGTETVTFSEGENKLRDVKPRHNEKELPFVVAQICAHLMEAQPPKPVTLAAIYGQMTPETQSRWQTREGAIQKIDLALMKLEKRGCIKRPLKGMEILAAYTLTEDGITVINHFLNPLYELVSDKSAIEITGKDGRTHDLVEDILPAVQADLSGYAYSSYLLSYPYLPLFKFRNYNNTHEAIRNALRQAGTLGNKGATTAQMQAELATLGYHISTGSIRVHIEKINQEKGKRVRTVKKRGTVEGKGLPHYWLEEDTPLKED